MKIKYVMAVVVGAVLGFGLMGGTIGCVMGPKGDGSANVVMRLDPKATADVIRAVVPAGVVLAVNKDANSAAYLRAASIAVRAAASGGAYDPAKLEVTLSTISVKELRTPEARAAIAGALGIYRAYFGDAVTAKLNQNEYLVPVLRAIADGIDAGLGPPPMPVR